MTHNENNHSDKNWVFFSEIGHCDFSMSQMIGESESECLKMKKIIREINVHEFFQEKLVSRKTKSLHSAGWKCHDFSVTQILREINFWDSRNAKPAILTHLEGLDF